tara:strand:+ start:4301 stop:4690 length:390 start_codon:yes stop_codon:yes gene_type:complete
MKIKDIHIQELAVVCNDLLFKTLVELGQNKNEDWLLAMSNSLANDLKQDFKNLEFQDIVQAFREGVRNTDNVRFVINVQSYYIWIKAHQDLIWQNDDKELERRDKRLKYRSRKGTGLNSISNNIKQLKK